jgi:hypothetical protein
MTPANGSFSSSVSVFHNPIASNQELLAEEDEEDDDVPPFVENQEVGRLLLRGFLMVLDPARSRSSQWRGRLEPSTACNNQSIRKHHPTSFDIIVVMVLVCVCQPLVEWESFQAGEEYNRNSNRKNPNSKPPTATVPENSFVSRSFGRCENGQMNGR